MKKILLLLTLFLVSGYYTIGHNQSGDTKAKTETFREAKFTIVDQTTKKPVSNKVVYDAKGTPLGSSDMNGLVAIAVPATAKEPYTIKVEGFNPVDINLKFATKKASTYEVLLSTSILEEAQLSVNAPSEEKVKVYVKQDPETYVKQPKQKGEELELVFAVQLSASSRPVEDMKSLSSWEELGPLYVYTENSLYKVRIGPFDTQDEAKQVLLKVKEKGKKDAFIVIQEGLEGYEPEGYVKYEEPMVIDEKFITSGREPMHPKKDAVVEEVKAPTQAVKAEPAPILDDSEVIEYKVRLASYLKPGGFSAKDIDKYGKLESYRKGEWTILLIGGFKTLEEAKKVRNEVLSKGFPDAMVVADTGGILEDVK